MRARGSLRSRPLHLQRTASSSRGGTELGGLLLADLRGAALLEAVLAAARDELGVAHAARARGAAALGLQGPLVVAHLLGRVAARRAALLLVVVRALAAADALAVRLLMALAHRRGAIAAANQAGGDEDGGAIDDARLGERLRGLQVDASDEET